MRSIRQAGSGYVARDVMWLQRGMRLGRGVFYAASTTNAYATIRRVVEKRDPALAPSTVDFAVGVAAALGAGFRSRMRATYLPSKYDKPTSRAMASVYVQTDVVQPVQTAGQGRPVPEMLCGTADVVDPELTQSGFTPPEESGPLPRVSRAEEYQKRGYKTGRRIQSTVRRPERPILDPPISELQPETLTQAPEGVIKAASEELWEYKIPKRRRRTPSPSSSSSSDESASSQSQKSESLPRRRAESYESIMPKLARENIAAPSQHEKSSRRKRGRASVQRYVEAKRAAKGHRMESKRRCGDDDIKDVLKQLTEEVRRDRADRSGEVNRRRSPVQSESRSRVPQCSRWSRSGWRAGGGARGDTRHGAWSYEAKRQWRRT